MNSFSNAKSCIVQTCQSTIVGVASRKVGVARRKVGGATPSTIVGVARRKVGGATQGGRGSPA